MKRRNTGPAGMARSSSLPAIRRLRYDEELPEGTPRRYRNGVGYIRLRWKVEPGRYVEEYEHRIVAGRPHPRFHVHHINGIKDDNRPENLQVLTAGDHRRLHDEMERTADPLYGQRRELAHEDWRRQRSERKQARLRRLIALYAEGFSLPEIGRMVGLDSGRVYRYLADAGVAMRTKADYSLIDIEHAKAEYGRGRSLTSLARQYRVDTGNLTDALRDAGVQIRRPGRPRNHPAMAENGVRLAVRVRSGGKCEVCGLARATNFQHRKNRSQLGEWAVVNGLDVCGMGNASGCHGRIHQNPAMAYAFGYSVRSTDDPASTPVWLAGRGWCHLTESGEAIPAPGIPDPQFDAHTAGCAVWTSDNPCDCDAEEA